VLRRKHFCEDAARKIIVEMVAALKHMHTEHIVHCDLKPENVLCTHDPSAGSDDWDIKITDFGLSKPVVEGDHSELTYCGSPLYMSPEMLFKQAYTYATDMWSLGCMLFELLCGSPPFARARNMASLSSMVKSYKGFGSTVEGQEVDEVATDLLRQLEKCKVSPAAQEFLCRLLDPDQARRISAEEAMQHEWLSVVADQEMHLDQAVRRLSENRSMPV